FGSVGFSAWAGWSTFTSSSGWVGSFACAGSGTGSDLSSASVPATVVSPTSLVGASAGADVTGTSASGSPSSSAPPRKAKTLKATPAATTAPTTNNIPEGFF